MIAVGVGVLRNRWYLAREFTDRRDLYIHLMRTDPLLNYVGGSEAVDLLKRLRIIECSSPPKNVYHTSDPMGRQTHKAKRRLEDAERQGVAKRTRRATQRMQWG
jgi:hypothetical protein